MTLASDGAVAAEEILRDVYQIDVAKALNPLRRSDFGVIVERLAASLRRVTGRVEAAAMRTALERLDVDWRSLSARGREAVVRAARDALGAVPARVMPGIDHSMRVEALRTVGNTRTAVVRQYNLRISSTMTAMDTRIADHVRASTTSFITDAYGRRVDALSAVAREVVANGLEHGLGRDEIAGDLSRVFARSTMHRSDSYWRVVAGVFQNRARTYEQLSAYREARVAFYRFEAVMDERTTEECRYYHERIFSVDVGASIVDRVSQVTNPEEIRTISPFVRNGRDEQGNRILYIERGGARTTIAQIERSGLGVRDDRGTFSRGMSSRDIEREGIPMPPLHELCRSTIVAEV